MMNRSLFILAADHRGGLAKLMGVSYPFCVNDRARAQMLKGLIWEGFLQAREIYRGEGELGFLIDEETGTAIIKAGHEAGVTMMVSTENSGPAPVKLLYGGATGEHLHQLGVGYAKLLLHFDKEKRAEQLEAIKTVTESVKKSGLKLLIEPLHEDARREQAIIESIDFINSAGFTPDIWKLEGVETTTAWINIAQHAGDVPMVMLGRGEGAEAVEKLLKVAAKSGAVKGFAIGRTIFWEPLTKLISGSINQMTAVSQIADGYLKFIKLWEDNQN